MRFRAWYSGGRVFDGETVADFKALPSDGVVWINEFRTTGVGRFNGGDWYYIRDGVLAYVPSVEWDIHRLKPPGCQDCIKRGVRVTDEEFARVMAEAKAAHVH